MKALLMPFKRLYTNRKEETQPMELAADLGALRIRIERLKSRRSELERILAGVDSRYLLSQEAFDAQAEHAENAETLERLQRELTLAEQIAADDHRREGEELTTELLMRFERIDLAEAQHQAALLRLAEERRELAEDAKAQLHAHPERLAALLREHMPYEDEVVDLLRCNLAYREKLAVVGHDSHLFAEQHGLPHAFLRINPDVRPDWRRAEVDELQAWIARYVESKRQSSVS